MLKNPVDAIRDITILSSCMHHWQCIWQSPVCWGRSVITHDGTMATYAVKHPLCLVLFCWSSRLLMVYARFGGKFITWRHNGHDGVSNHQPRHCLLNRLFRCRSKKTSKLRVSGLCAENSPVTGEFPAQRPVTRKMFPFDDIIMFEKLKSHIICIRSNCLHCLEQTLRRRSHIYFTSW